MDIPEFDTEKAITTAQDMSKDLWDTMLELIRHECDRRNVTDSPTVATTLILLSYAALCMSGRISSPLPHLSKRDVALLGCDQVKQLIEARTPDLKGDLT